MKRTGRIYLSLRFKLAFSALLAVLVSMALLSLMLQSTIRSQQLGYMLSDAGRLARSLDRAIRLQREVMPPLSGQGEETPFLLRTLLSFSEEENILGLSLYDTAGREVAHQGRLFRLPEKGWSPGPGGAEYLRLAGSPPMLMVRADMSSSVPPLRLGLLFSLERTNQIIALSQLKAVLQISASALFIFLFLLLILTFMVVNPLKALGRGMERISSGNLDYRVELARRDEFGFVAESFNSMAERLRDNRSTIEQQLAALRDAHHRTIETQQKLIAAEKMASLGTLAAGVAHEVGNPLQAAVGCLDLLSKGGLSDEERRDLLQRASSELTRIHRIMLELLNYARPSPAPAEPLDVNALLTATLEGLRRDGSLEGVEVRLDLEERLPSPSGAPHRLEQVFTNLISNAVWAMGGRGRLAVGSRFVPPGEDDLPGVAVTFTDDGRGISPQEKERIFDPFFTTRLGQGGTGLGLAISRRIIEEMGGRICLESTPGEGSTFTVRLPA